LSLASKVIKVDWKEILFGWMLVSPEILFLISIKSLSFSAILASIVPLSAPPGAFKISY